VPCSRVGDDICCYIGGVLCGYVVDAGPLAVPRWACSLMSELGSWAAVHADARYQTNVRSAWDAITRSDGTPMPDCGDWEGPCTGCGLGVG
jgi:hypothetical protein